MYLDRVDEIHVTTVHTSASGEVLFPDWNRDEWTEEVIESFDADEDNEHSTRYSVWTKS